MSQHIGVAVSGGGHRASMWGLGPLLYLVDAGKNGEVGAISSVSGGSITNGVVAHEVDYAHVSPAAFDQAVRPLVHHVAEVGLFFWGPATNTYVRCQLASAFMGVAVFIAGVVLLCLQGLTWAAAATLLAGIVILALVARWFERRSDILDMALAKTHFHADGQPTALSAVERSLDHIFCATELQSADHLYFAPTFVSSYALGHGTPANLRLSTAVQASACLPGAFSRRRLPVAPHVFTGGTVDAASDMVLVDVACT